jgi:hypothetical protein
MQDHAHTHTDFDRRKFLRNAVSGAAIGIAAQAGIELTFPLCSARKPISLQTQLCTN